LRIAIVAFGETSGDHAIGIEVLSRISRDHLPDHAVLINGGTDVLKALEAVRGFDGLIIVNAATMGDPPGTVRTLDLNELVFSGDPASITLHGMKRNSELILAHKFMNLPPTKIVCIEPGALAGAGLSQPLLSNLDCYIHAVKQAGDDLSCESK
jgi:hydrogenase maturation protease